jgi:RNA polymerase sigma-70 factor (ECF subfamily)
MGDAQESVLETMAAPEGQPIDGSIEKLLERGDVSPASRSVLVLHFQEGLSLPEVASVLELPLGTVKSRLGYGLSVLRRRLDREESER